MNIVDKIKITWNNLYLEDTNLILAHKNNNMLNDKLSICPCGVIIRYCKIYKAMQYLENKIAITKKNIDPEVFIIGKKMGTK